MLIRALCVFLLLGVGPVTTWATTLCCHADEACCEEDAPSCPVLPDGSCALAAASHAVATVSAAPEPLPPLAVVSFDFAAIVPRIAGALAAPAPHPDPPPLIRSQPLRS